jgi:hypothetical protein
MHRRWPVLPLEVNLNVMKCFFFSLEIWCSFKDQQQTAKPGESERRSSTLRDVAVLVKTWTDTCGAYETDVGS